MGEGCYWANFTNRFHCMPAGSDPEMQSCEPSTPNSCEPGLICVTNPEIGDSTQCLMVCHPETDDGICGGPCSEMGNHSYNDPNGMPIEDIGFCYFLGG